MSALKSKLVAGSCILTFVLCAVSFFFRPGITGDLLPYAELALISEGYNPHEAHSRAFAELKRDPSFAEALSNHPDRQLEEREPDRLIIRLPFYVVKPLYYMSIGLLHRLGFTLPRIFILISASSYIGICVVAFLWTRRYLPEIVAAIISIYFALSSLVFYLGRMSTPDGMATFLVLHGVFLIMETQYLGMGLGIAALSIHARADEFLVVLGVLAALIFLRKLKWLHGLVLAVAIAIAVFAVGRAGGYPGWATQFTVGMNGSWSGVVTVPFYLHAVVNALTVLRYSTFYVSVLLAGVTLLMWPRHPLSIVLFGMALGTLVHFLLYPTTEERIYATFTLSSLIIFFAVVGDNSKVMKQEPALQALTT